jgi:hypothetical protein
VEGFEGAHACVDGGGFGVGGCIPGLGDVGGGGVEGVVAFVVERHRFEAVLCFLDVGA